MYNVVKEIFSLLTAHIVHNQSMGWFEICSFVLFIGILDYCVLTVA